MSAEIVYRLNRSSEAEIVDHLLCADGYFEPSLSDRVDIRVYAKKLHDRAVRFEAWSRKELVGLVASYCNRHEVDRAFVTSVSVLPAYQGSGIAGRLMLQCIEHVRSLHFRQIELATDQRSRPAVALYRKLGFKIVRSGGFTLTMSMDL